MLVSFEPHCGRNIPSETECWEPLNGDDVSDIIVDSTKLIMWPFCDFTDAKRPTRHPPSDYYMASVFPQTPFPEVRKLTKTTPAASLRD